MNTYDVQCIAYPRPIERIRAESSFAARKAYAEKHGCELTDVIARRIWEDDKSPCYCAAAVNKAIEASNRATRHISAKEACLIHALLKGPCQITHLTIGSPAS